MNLKKILFLAALCMALPASMFAETELNAIDKKIAQLVGKDNVSTAKKVVAGVVIAAIALPVLYFASRAALKPCLKYQYNEVDNQSFVEGDCKATPGLAAMYGIFNSNIQKKYLPQGTLKSFAQSFFRIPKTSENEDKIQKIVKNPWQ